LWSKEVTSCFRVTFFNIDNRKFSKSIENSNESVKSSAKKSQIFNLPLINDDKTGLKRNNFESGVTKLLNSMTETINPFKKYLQFDGHVS
jgi:molecular chaperone DnaK (HSP70)